MGWLKNLLFGGSVAENTVTGAALGAFIADKIDEREDRQHIIALLEAQLAQGTYQRAMDRVDAYLRQKPQENPYDNWHWGWKVPDECTQMYLDCANRHASEKLYRILNSQLVIRWYDLRDRAMRVGVMPLKHMPRSVSGDVVGTPGILKIAMDKLQHEVEEAEYLAEVEQRYGHHR